MSTLAELQALANEAAEIGVDLTVAVSGGTARLLPAGYAFGRLVEVVELGNQPQEFQGKAKDPAREVELAFALYGDGYQNDDGTPYIARMYPMAISPNEKSRSFKMFKLLNWDGLAKNFGQMLGKAWLVKIVHTDKSKTDKTQVSRIDPAGFLPPFDPVTKQAYAIPQPDEGLYRLFMWDKPTKAGWDALYREGKWDDGKSKNKTQETMLAALDFHGSALQLLLLESGVQNLPTAATAAVPALPATPTAPVVPATPVVAAAAVPASPVPAVVAVPLAVSPPAQVVAVPASPVVAVLPGMDTAQAVSVSSPILPTTSPSE